MHSTYAQTQKTAQKKEASTAAAVLDASSQNEGLQRKADMMNNAAQRAEAPRPNNTGMPDNLKSGIESLSGFSMDDVRVHYNSSKPATVQALAYTQGTDIHVAPDQEKHLPHEAWHVAQQMAGRVSPTTNINGMPVNDNAALEHEADVMGEKAVQCKCNGFLTITKNLFLDKTIQCVTYNQADWPKCFVNGMLCDNKDQRMVRDRIYISGCNYAELYNTPLLAKNAANTRAQNKANRDNTIILNSNQAAINNYGDMGTLAKEKGESGSIPPQNFMDRTLTIYAAQGASLLPTIYPAFGNVFHQGHENLQVFRNNIKIAPSHYHAIMQNIKRREPGVYFLVGSFINIRNQDYHYIVNPFL